MFHYLIRTDQADIAVETDNIPDSLKKYGIADSCGNPIFSVLKINSSYTAISKYV